MEQAGKIAVLQANATGQEAAIAALQTSLTDQVGIIATLQTNATARDGIVAQLADLRLLPSDTTACHGVHIRSDADFALMAPPVRSCGVMNGDMLIQGTSLNASQLAEAFAHLRQVVGRLEIQSNPTQTSATLMAVFRN